MDQDPARLPAEIPHPIFAVVSEGQTAIVQPDLQQQCGIIRERCDLIQKKIFFFKVMK